VTPREFRDAQNHAPVLRARDARQAAPLGHVRYVLAISVGAAAVAGAVIWLAFFA
jgi:hypothetical protein